MAREKRALGALPPFAILIATGIWLRLRWEEIPQHFPTHWDISGQANRWGARTPGSVFQPLIIGAAVCISLLIVRSAMRSGFPTNLSHKDTRWQSMRVLGGMAWLVAAVFSVVAILPLFAGKLPLWWVLAVILLATAAMLIPMVRAAMNPSTDPAPKPPADAWRMGVFYYNPADPALMVQKRFGIGYTLNFANPKSWLVLAAALLPLAAGFLLKRA